MALMKPDMREALAGMRAIKAVVTADGPMQAVQATTMELAQRHFLGTHEDVSALEPITPEDLASAIKGEELRRQLVQVMCGYVMLGREIRPAHIALIQRYAKELGIDEPAVDHLRYVVEDRLRWLRFDFRRRALLGDVVQQAYRDDGVLGAAGAIMQIAGFGEDAALAARFDALGGLPEGTLGRELVEFSRSNGFALPGHKDGTPLPLIVHDMMHVLSGYPTDVLGEVRTLAFQTGFKRDKPLMFIFLLLYQLQIGVEMVQLAKGVGTMQGFFDQPGVIEEVFNAYNRGASMNIDLMDGSWDYWAVMDRPLAELRARYGVPA